MRLPARASQRLGDPPRLLLLCPLHFERQALERLRRREHGGVLPAEVAIEVCGPGRLGVERWFAGRDACPARDGVILVGTAGGLHAELAPGCAFVADRVIDGSNRSWTPTLPLHASTRRLVRAETVLSVEFAATSPQEKARHRASSGATAIDLESAPFAEHCEMRAWRWSVVRGVSDGASERLPHEVARWVDARGRLRTLAMLASLLRSPGTVAMLPRLRRRSAAALRAAAAIVAQFAAAPPEEALR